MPVDDPGWGDYTPLPGEPSPGQTPAEPQAPVQPEERAPVQPEERAPVPPSTGGGSNKTPIRIALGVLVALALAAGGYFLLAGDDSDEPGDERPAVAVTGDEDDQSAPGEESPGDEETPDGEETPEGEETPGDAPTTAEYISEADRICRRFTPDINEASQDNDISRLVRLYKAMVGRLSLQVLPPGEDGDVIQGMLDDFFRAAEELPNDYELALQFASAAQTTAFQMGFEDCSEA